MKAAVAFFLVIAWVWLAACGGDGASARPTPDSGNITGTLTVYAASSLTDAFKEIGVAFDAAHPGVTTEFNFAGSPTLRTQLEQGASADVLVVADQANMQAALDRQLVVDMGQTFVRNRLAIIVPKGNPGGVATAPDLAKPGIKLVLAQKDVPVGKYARESIAKMVADPSFGAGFDTNVQANVVSEEPNVKAVVTKVQLGEADAGIVYVTDVTAGVAGDVETIAIPDAYNIIASYPIAVRRDAAHGAAARAFITFVLASEGQAIVQKYRFLPPR